MEEQLLLIESAALPEVFRRVVEANRLLESGEAASASQAARMAGVSRSVYYKYRGAVKPYRKPDSTVLTLQATLVDRPGVLMSLLAVFYRAGANILTVNQSVPVKGRAFVSVSARLGRDGEMLLSTEDLLGSLRLVDGVVKIESISE